MDTISLITAVVVTGLFLLIFLLPTINAKKNQKKMHTKLTEIAAEQNAEVTKSVILGDSIVGLDEKKGIVFYYKQQKDTDISKFLLLSEIKACKMFSQTKSAKSENANYNQYEKLGLKFICIDNNKSDTLLEFYNFEENSNLNLDVNVLEQWGTMLNARLIQN